MNVLLDSLPNSALSETEVDPSYSRITILFAIERDHPI